MAFGKHLYNIGDIINDFKILEQTWMRNSKGTSFKSYTVKCIKDGYIKENEKELLLRYGCGCPVCCNKIIVKGINDIATTNPELVKYFFNENNAYKYSAHSGEKAKFKCIRCGFVKEMRIADFTKKGFSCNNCSDKISYPEKVVSNVLYQFGIEYIKEYSPKWIKPYRYDFYFKYNNKEYIIETDGLIGHGNINSLERSISPELSSKIDKYKDNMAEKHNIHMIRIDCMKSDIDYIKNNIINSKLSSVLNLSNILWKECDTYANNSLVQEAAHLWNKYQNTTKICDLLHLSRNCVIDYLYRGTKIGWCNYNPNLGKKNGGKKNSKPIKVYNNNDELIHESESISLLYNESEKLFGFKIYPKQIRKSLNNNEYRYKNLYFTL